MDHHHHHHHEPLISPPLPSASASVAVNVIGTTLTQQDLDHDIHDHNNNLNMSSSSPSITLRLCFISLIALASLWANHEASRGFPVTIINEAHDTFSGKRFNLFYVSNDEATRIIIRTSKTIENFLYPSYNMPKKQVSRIICKLVDRNLTDGVIVDSDGADQFVVNISPSILEGPNFRHDMTIALKQGIARVWLFNGRGKSPIHLINGIVEYITNNLLEQGRVSILQIAEPTAVCRRSEDPKAVAEFLKSGEIRRPGFIAKLNQAMKDEWSDDMFDAALGVSLCTTHAPLRYNFSSLVYSM